MRQRHSVGGVRKQRGKWIGHWYADGKRKSQIIGRIKDMTKSEAREEVAKIAAAERVQLEDNCDSSFGDFVDKIYLPFYTRKWKQSTDGNNRNRIEVHLMAAFRDFDLSTFNRNELQDFLDAKAQKFSFSTVAHLRWDLKAIFDLAVAEGALQRNPALLLFTPRTAPRPKREVMTIEHVRTCFRVLVLRERLIAKLAILAGMRPGEIFALRWGRMSDHADIRERVYRGIFDTPKTVHSEREAALSLGLLRDLENWKQESIVVTDDALVFPSERMTPLRPENVWRRHIGPKLKAAGLGWVNFQVMRRTSSTLLNALGVEGKMVADQLGHTLDVNQNVYTQSQVGLRQNALNLLEATLEPT
jgi:integrase